MYLVASSTMLIRFGLFPSDSDVQCIMYHIIYRLYVPFLFESRPSTTNTININSA